MKRQTRKEKSPWEMKAVLPFSALVKALEPLYPQGERPPYELETMVRIHLMQNWWVVPEW